MFTKIALTLGIIVACTATLVSGSTDVKEYRPIALDMYHEAWEPFITVTIWNGDTRLRRGSGFLIKHIDEETCHVYAVTNHHVIFGEKALREDADTVPDLSDTNITVQLAHKLNEEEPRIHLAELLRTSRSADVAVLLVPHLSCDTTQVAQIAQNNFDTVLGDKVWQVVASGAEPGNTEVKSGEVTRFGVDPQGDMTLSTSVPIYRGMSGSPVFRRRLWRYEVIGIAKSHSVDETPEGVQYPTGTNYIVPVEILHILLRG